VVVGVLLCGGVSAVGFLHSAVVVYGLLGLLVCAVLGLLVHFLHMQSASSQSPPALLQGCREVSVRA